MSRIDPPPLATWILEHGVPGQRDQALAGDLLEEFEGGRSNGWYWRQCLAAFLVGWTRYLGSRISLVVFAALWSLLAPAWSMIIDRVRSRDVAWPLSAASWVALNLAFIWTGMLLFACLHRQFSHAIATRKLIRAFVVAAGIFLPAYFATFVLANLFVWPGLDMQHRGISPLSEIADFRMWADALRIPYFVTFLWSMWSVAPIMAATPVAVVEWNSSPATTLHDTTPEPVYPYPGNATRMFVFMVVTGLLNAMIAGFVLCRLPEVHHPSLQSVFARAALYVAIGAIAGIVGTYLYWHNPASSFRNNPPLPFPLFALVCAAGWVWVPAMVLFSEQVSVFSAGVAMIAAFLLAGELRRITLLVLPPASQPALAFPAAERTLFAESLYRPPAEPGGYLIALCLYAAGWAITSGSNMTAGVLLASVASLFKLRTTYPPSPRFRQASEYRRAALRLACLALPAILITSWALLDGVARRNHLLAPNGPGMGIGKSSGTHTPPKSVEKNSTHVGSGYESVILWPYPPKKEIVAPIQPAELLTPGTTQPVVIRFNGEYWYLQPPDLSPGPDAHHANGTPLDLHIASSNSFPLIMQAHQYLHPSVRLARCREIRVEIESRETDPASVALAVWLKNSSNANAPAVYLGEQIIAGAATAPASTISETLMFSLPASAKIRAFDEISLMVLPDSGHQRVGPRIAIRQFEFVPR